MQGNEIRLGYETMLSEQSVVQSTWETINKLIVPFRGGFWRENSNETSIDWHDQRGIFDSTAPMANNLLASSIHSALTNPAYQWFDIVFRDPEVAKKQRVMQWSQEATRACYHALQDSNFDLEANEVYLDLPSYGTGFIIQEEVTKNGTFEELNFQSVPLKEALFEEDHLGQVSKFYRQYRWTAVQIESKFGRKGLPDKIAQLLTTNQAAVTKHKVTFCIYPRHTKADNKDSFQKLSPLERPYGYKYILHDSAEQLGEEGGYYEMPAYVPRWRKTNQSKYGNSPGMIALPDILTVNRLVELILKATEKVVDPANLVTERGLLSNLDLQPSGMSIVRDLDRSVKPYESRARFDVSQLQREKLQQSINQIFYVDQLQLKESPAMTATEVQVRYELMQRLLGPTFGRMKSDFLNPLVERTFKILYRSGQIDNIPEEAMTDDGIPRLDIVYTGPMARAQRSEKMNDAFGWVGQMAQIAGMHPSLEPILDHVNADAFAVDTAASASISAALLNDKKTVDKIRQGRTQQQQVAQMQQAGEAAKAVGEGAQAVETAEGGQDVEATE